MNWPGGLEAAFSLRVDVETSNCLIRGLRVLNGILEEHGLKATVFIPMGPDRVWMGFNRSRVKGYLRLNPVRKFGLKTLMGGLLFPPWDMGELCIEAGVNRLGHEFALHGYDHAGWARTIRGKPPHEAMALFMKGYSEYRRVFGKPPMGFASPEFKWTAETLRLLDTLGFKYGSDFKSEAPFKPVIGGAAYNTLQIPVTLPNLEELSLAGLSDAKALKAVEMALDWKIRSGGLAVLHIHPSYEVLFKKDIFEALLKYVDARRDRLWTATMAEIADYWNRVQSAWKA